MRLAPNQGPRKSSYSTEKFKKYGPTCPKPQKGMRNHVFGEHNENRFTKTIDEGHGEKTRFGSSAAYHELDHKLTTSDRFRKQTEMVEYFGGRKETTGMGLSQFGISRRR